jgi:drug/metabolite transporter (DMT)-like permease
MSITLLFSTLYMYRNSTPDFPFGQKGIRLLLCFRGVGGFLGVYGMYYSLLYLPLADATVITFIAPSLACWACSYILKEPFTRMEQIAAMVSLFGVVLIARPTSFLSTSNGGETGANGGADGIPASMNGTAQAVNGTQPTYDLNHVTPQQRAEGVGVALLGVIGPYLRLSSSLSS